jgi:hypothetical protein
MMKMLAVFLGMSLSLNCFGMGGKPPPTKVGKNPADISDVLGRDLNIAGVGAIGHVGLWTGSEVIEILNLPQVIYQNSLSDFKNRTKYWGATYFSDWNRLPDVWMADSVTVPYSYTRYTAKRAAIVRAFDIKKIGATYTISPIAKFSFSEQRNASKCTKKLPGSYRCDTFVKDAYMNAGVPNIHFDLTDTPSSFWSQLSERR